jgi:methionyl aminopeptidase
LVKLKSEREIKKMREAGKIAGLVLSKLEKEVFPDVTTKKLDELAEKYLKEYKAKPAFKGYQGFPAILNVSINDEVVHGIPSEKRKIKTGDIVSIDIGTIVDGYYGDTAITVMVNEVPKHAKDLVERTRDSLFRGISKAKAGNRIGDISYTIQAFVEGYGYSVVRDLAGHGVGRNLHEDPQVPNFGRLGHGPLLKAGMTIAIEPMVNIGTYRVIVQPDFWTVVTADHSLSAHFEHTVLITEDEPEILTLRNDEQVQKF